MRVSLGTLERNSQEEVELDEQARMRHFCVLGKSGVGKTTLLRNMIISDLCSGVGCTIVDPHGGLIEEIISHIPRSRVNDVIYIHPAQRERIVGLNVLESVRPEERHLVVQSLISIVKHAFPESWGPRSEWVLEHAVMALLESPDSPALTALPKLLTNTSYRASIMTHVTDPAVRSFFAFYEKENPKLREESIVPLLNKVSKFVTNPLLRAIIGQRCSSFDFRWAMDRRKIILIDVSKGALGESASSILGSLIVTKLALASLSRQDTPEEERVPHLLYVDEAHNFGYGVDYSTILSESRKYRLGLVIGTQTLSQFSAMSPRWRAIASATTMRRSLSGILPSPAKARRPLSKSMTPSCPPPTSRTCRITRSISRPSKGGVPTIPCTSTASLPSIGTSCVSFGSIQEEHQERIRSSGRALCVTAETEQWWKLSSTNFSQRRNIQF